MARNGSGTYSNPYPNFVSGTVISSAETDANNSDIATALTQSIAVDGQAVVTANIPLATHKLTGVSAGSAATDSLSLGQAQAEAFIWCGTAGGSADAITLAPSPAITAYAAGQRFVWMASSSVNTGATTVAISGLTAIALQDNGAALVAGNHAASKMFMGILNTTSTVQIMQVQISGTDPLLVSSLTVSGTSLLTGVTTHGDDVVSDTDSTDDLGTTSVRWANLFVDGITATDQITATGFTGTLDGILGSGTPAAATVTTIDASGVATATTFEPDGDTSASDNAAIGYTSSEGLILTGQGSTSDITLKNNADGTVFTVPTGTDDILFPDAAKAMWGTDSDLKIYHSGSYGYFTNNTGMMHISADALNLTNYAINETYIAMVADAGVTLYFNNAAKLATVTGGIEVTGDVVSSGTVEPAGDTAAGNNAAIGYTAAEGLILTGQGSTSDIILKNDADGTVFTVPTGTDDILFPDSAKAMWGAGSDLQIYHDGSNSYILDSGTGKIHLGGDGGVNITNAAVDENFIICETDGAVTLYFNNSARIATSSAGVTITGEAIATGFTGTLDGILGSGAAAAASVTTLTTSGIASIDDTTDTTSGTTGSIHTDGGLGIAKKLHVIGTTTHGGDVLSDTDSTDSLGSTGVRWAGTWTDAINGVTAPTAQYTSAEETKLSGIETSADVTDATNVLAGLVGQEAVATGFTGTLDGVLGGGSAAAASVTTLTASGTVSGTDMIMQFAPTTPISGTSTNYQNGALTGTDASLLNTRVPCPLTVKKMYIYVNGTLSSGSAVVTLMKDAAAQSGTIAVDTSTGSFDSSPDISFTVGQRIGIKIVTSSASAAWYHVTLLCERDA